MQRKEVDMEYLSKVQYASTASIRARWDLYTYTVPFIDIHKTGIQQLNLKGTEDVLDLGCCDGELLYYMRTVNKHTGRLVGLDIQEKLFADVCTRQQQNPLNRPIEFVVGSADTLPFPDNSFDAILAFFMLYHMSDIQQTLREWHRVLKPGGRLLVATSSQTNRPKHKAMKLLIESMLGKKAPRQFSTSFNLENGPDQLKRHFTIVDTFIYTGEIRPPGPEMYINALHSIRDMYQPAPVAQEWERAMAAARESFLNEIKEKGYFSDFVKRGFYICEKE